MKAVILSTVLLISVLFITVLNAAFVGDRVENMKDLAIEICENGSQREEAVEKLYSIWENSRVFFSLSAGLREIDRATENLLSLKEACLYDNEWEIRQRCVLFCNALDDIVRYERISLENIL